MFYPESIFDAMEHYSAHCDSHRFSMLKTAIQKYAIPEWQKISGNSSSSPKQVPITAITQLVNLVTLGCRQTGCSSRTESKYRSYTKKFIEFCQEEGWLSTSSSSQAQHDLQCQDSSTTQEFLEVYKSLGKQHLNAGETRNYGSSEFYRFKAVGGQKRIYQVSSTGIKRSANYGLGTQPG
ncbi:MULTISPECIES: hypothetical protein, partial [Trichocoleus]